MLEEKLGKKPGGQGSGPPSAENPCSYCGSPDHFFRDCPIKKKADEQKKKAEEANNANETK